MSRKSRALPPFRRFDASPEVIWLVALTYVRFPLSLRNVEDLPVERGIDVCHETIRFRWNRFGPLFAADIRRQRASAMRCLRHWRWHLDELFVRINGEQHYLWRVRLSKQNVSLVQPLSQANNETPCPLPLLIGGD